MSDFGFRVKPGAGSEGSVTARVLEEMPKKDFGCRISDFG